MKSNLLAGFSVLLLAFFGTAPANAQVDLSPGVARVSLIHGEVSTQRGDSGDWAAAALNAPITSGDKISTGDRSRAEVQLDYANILRLGERSRANLAALTRTQIQIQIGRGLADYTVFKGTEAEVEIDTPNVAIHPSRKDGSYRIEVNSDGETRVIVRKGEAEISTPQGSTRIEKGQLVTVRGTAEDSQYKIADAPSKDDWDSWNSDRDRLIRDAQAWRYTNRYYVGAEDLDAYGRWVTVPDYGPVWAPVVAAGWAPYRAGRWVWEPYWGWTWVSYEPWGWAPYHYGRWFVYGGSWVWWPGPVVAYRAYRPIWAPAYVSFFGFGHRGFHFGVAFGFGSVGWLPIGPGDPFFPWYGRFRSHFNVVNVTNVFNITNRHSHWNGRGLDGMAPLRTGNSFSNLRLAASDERIRQAISTVPADRFGTGRVAATPVSREMFRDGGMMRGNLPVVPGRESLSATDRPASPSTLPRGGQQERFFMKSRPAAAPEPFERQAARVQQAIQRDGRFRPIPAETRSEAPHSAPGAAAPPARMSGMAREMPRGFGAEPVGETPMRRGISRGEATPPSAGMNSGGSIDSAPRNDGWRRFGWDLAQNRPQAPAPSASEAKPSSPEQPGNRPPRSTNSAAPDGAGWRRFSDSNSGQRGHRPGLSRQQPESQNERPSGAVNPAPARPTSRMNSPSPPAESSSPARNQGWERFTPQPRPAVPESLRRESGFSDQESRSPSPGEARGVENYPRESRAPAYRESMRSSRPPLDLRQPIVTPRVSRETPGSYRGAGQRSGGRAEPNSGGGGRGRSGGDGQSRSSSGDRRRN